MQLVKFKAVEIELFDIRIVINTEGLSFVESKAVAFKIKVVQDKRERLVDIQDVRKVFKSSDCVINTEENDVVKSKDAIGKIEAKDFVLNMAEERSAVLMVVIEVFDEVTIAPIIPLLVSYVNIRTILSRTITCKR